MTGNILQVKREIKIALIKIYDHKSTGKSDGYISWLKLFGKDIDGPLLSSRVSTIFLEVKETNTV